jgi:hypothetical protein
VLASVSIEYGLNISSELECKKYHEEMAVMNRPEDVYSATYSLPGDCY